MKPRRRQGPNIGKPIQGVPKELNAFTMEKDIKRKDQELLKEEQPSKPPKIPKSIKRSEGPKHSRWGKHSAPSGTKIGEPHYSLGLEPHLYNIMWQVRISFSFWTFLYMHIKTCLYCLLFPGFYKKKFLCLII